MSDLVLGGKVFPVSEPCFRDLRLILNALNQLNSNPDDQVMTESLQIIMTALIGEDNVKKFRRFCWEAWKIPAPNSDELTAMIKAAPEICGLIPSQNTSDNKTLANDDWDSLYWRVIRSTGWSWQQVDTEMTLSRLTALSEHLLERPLTDDLVAAYLGYEYNKPRTLEDAIDEMLAAKGLDHG